MKVKKVTAWMAKLETNISSILVIQSDTGIQLEYWM